MITLLELISAILTQQAPYLVDSYLDKYTALANDRSTDVAFVT
jgi:hypothetical protein